MKKYRVDHARWIEGSGYSYVETIEETDEKFSSEDLGEYWGDYCCGTGDEIRLINNETNEEIARYTQED